MRVHSRMSDRTYEAWLLPRDGRPREPRLLCIDGRPVTPQGAAVMGYRVLKATEDQRRQLREAGFRLEGL